MIDENKLKKKAKKYADQEWDKDVEKEKTYWQWRYDNYIAGYRQCDADYEKWRTDSLNSQEDW